MARPSLKTGPNATTIHVNEPGLVDGGQWAKARLTGSATPLIKISADNVTLANFVLEGPGYSSFVDGEYGIHILGASAASPVRNVTLRDCVIRNFGADGIRAEWVDGFLIENCVVENCFHAGIMGLSALNGVIRGNRIDNITGDQLSNYGISLSRTTAADISTYPRSANVIVEGNKISNVLNWHGCDTHSGNRVQFIGNTITGCAQGLSIGPDSSGTQYPATLCVASGNIIDSGRTDGGVNLTTGNAFGINVQGVSFAYAYGCTVTGNTIYRHGKASAASGIDAGIYCQYTTGLQISGNTIIEPSPHGILMYVNNQGHSISGNTIIDPWTDTVAVGYAVGILALSSGNVGIWHGNNFEYGTKSATYLLTTAMRPRRTTYPTNYIDVQSGDYHVPNGYSAGLIVVDT